MTQTRRLVRSLTGVDEVLTFCLSGLSKVAGLPQMKLGWIVTGGPPADREQAFERLELIADTYLSVSAPVQWAAPALLGLRGQLQRQILGRVRANRAFLASSNRRRLSLEAARHRRRLVCGPGSAAHSKRRGMGAQSA